MIKATRVMPALLLQKRSKTSKPKDHLKALEKRLRLWEEGNTNELVNESNTMQERLPSTNSQINIEKIPSKFNKLILKSNVNGALSLLTNNMKHQEAQQAHHHGITRPKKINTQYCL